MLHGGRRAAGWPDPGQHGDRAAGHGHDPRRLLLGIKANLSGNTDAYWIEGSEIGQYDSAKQQFVQQGDIIDLSGKAKPCAWDQATSTCR